MPKGEHRKILIVENDEFMRRALERYCTNYSQTVAANTCRDAIDALDQKLIAVILDVYLPDGLGISVLEKIRECQRELPVLVITGDLSTQVVNRAYELGAEFLSKTDNSTRLKSFLDRAVNASFPNNPVPKVSAFPKVNSQVRHYTDLRKTQ